MAEDRRTVLKMATCALGGAAAVGVGGPVAVALIAPATLETIQGTTGMVEVMKLSALPEDGRPVPVTVTVEAPLDAWTKLPPTRVGTVYLRRQADGVEAFSTVCPHLGCRIDFAPASQQFVCPCHDSAFGLDGAVLTGPSPRAMDTLECKIDAGRVLVRFERFTTGIEEKRRA